jgi:NAD+ synthase
MNCDCVKQQIVRWLKNYNGYVIGISGGVDSACTSTLCAETGNPVICVSMPIHQPESHLVRANNHIKWLVKNFNSVKFYVVDLTETFEKMKNDLPSVAKTDIAMVNLRSRIRMATLYTFANSFQYVVAGTGNKVEDYGIGFFTKYGDGGVDISPIGDLLKTEVWEIAKYLKINDEIIKAKPTDGLWNDDRSDEDQIGASYLELESAMNFYKTVEGMTYRGAQNVISQLSERQKKVFDIYVERHTNSQHKMSMPPICKITK